MRVIIEDQCLGLVRFLGLAESHSVNLRLGGRFRLKPHAANTSQVVEFSLATSTGDGIEKKNISKIVPNLNL